MPSFESNLELNQNSLLRAVLHPFVEFPNSPPPVPGQVGYNANIGEQRPYFYNGSRWLPFNHIPNGSLTNTHWSNLPTDRLSFEKLATPTADFDFGNVRLTNLASPVDDQDAVNKAYADAIRETLDFKNSVRVATTGPLPPSTYNNGSGTITADSNGSINTLGIDGITDLVVGNRILVKDQLNQVENGIYTVTQLGSPSTPFVLTRASDADTGTKLTPGSVVYVEEGNVNARRRFTLVTPGVITLGASNLVFEQSSGLGQVNAGIGLIKTGDTLDVNLTGSNTITAIGNSLRVRSSSVQHQVLLSTGVSSSEASWGALPLNQPNAVTGALPIANGGTGATTRTTAFDALAPTSIAGQMIWFNGTNNNVIPPNTTSTVRFLSQVSSGQPTWTIPNTSQITSTHTPVNYTPTGTSLTEHIAAIDTAIGNFSNTASVNNLGTVVFEINTNTNTASITHPFQTRNLVVTVMRTDNFQIVYPEIVYNSLDQIRIIFSTPPPSGLYRAIIQPIATLNLRRFFVDINDTVNTSIVVNHNLGTRDVSVDVFQKVPEYKKVFVEVYATTLNSITLTFSSPPGNNIYRVMITG